MVARSNRKPLTPIELTQYRRLSVTSFSVRELVRFSVLPVPVSLM